MPNHKIFSNVAILKRRSTLIKFLNIVFISFNSYFDLIRLADADQDKIYSHL